MTSDYSQIKRENERQYGTEIGRIGDMLLADRYDDRTHFIFELLQNAEDALARRNEGTDRRDVDFVLSASSLRVSHYGVPFDKRDVRGICGIAESTKGDTAIGRFGIGFKSVYAFTDRPEIHSGAENFAIESFVWPAKIDAIESVPDKTVFVLPLKEADPAAKSDILTGLRRLGPRTLLFLREINEITWSAPDGISGTYLRGDPEHLSDHLRKVTVIGEDHATDDITEESWLIFSRNVTDFDGAPAGQVEIGFALNDADNGTEEIRPVRDATLVVYFPTIVPTGLGFLMQGPYKTTPSRDNIVRRDPWNQYLLHQTADLLVDALRTLRDLDLLSVEALQSLPLEPPSNEDNITATLFEAARAALKSEPLLPRYSLGYLSADRAMIARSQKLRELFSPAQVSDLFESDDNVYWLSELITQDQTPDLRNYMIEQLGVSEIVPWDVVSRFTGEFLEGQSDEWIVKLYKFLSDQPAFLRRVQFSSLPLVRLENGSHVVPFEDGSPNVYLPGDEPSEFPTARRSICEDESAREFLEELGMSEADLVDDVLINTLPRYESPIDLEITDSLESDVQRLLRAFDTDSTSQRKRLTDALSESYFVPSVDAGNGTKKLMRPPDVYLATDRLKELFDGVCGVFLVDDTHRFMRRESMRPLLETSGSTRYLKPTEIPHSFTSEELRQMREEAGESRSTGGETVSDFSLRGLNELLELLPHLSPEQARRRAQLLWEALHELVDRRGQGLGVFEGSYRWFYRTDRRFAFTAQWVNDLNSRSWVPDPDDVLRKPGDVVFETIDPVWEDDTFLRSKIEFRPHAVDELAAKIGLEPGVLNLLKDHGITTVAELQALLGVQESIVGEDSFGSIELPNGQSVDEDEFLETPVSIEHVHPGTTTNGLGEALREDGGHIGRAPKKTVTSESTANRGTGNESDRTSQPEGSKDHASKRTPRELRFNSYIGVHPDEAVADPDGLSHRQRMNLEEQSIKLILEEEPNLMRTPANNAGFDLFESNSSGETTRWIEVKAMNGTLNDRPVAISSTQFDYARQHREAFWLYVVERANDRAHACIARIQDPAGNARSFTFDSGWRRIAEVSEPMRASCMSFR